MTPRLDPRQPQPRFTPRVWTRRAIAATALALLAFAGYLFLTVRLVVRRLDAGDIYYMDFAIFRQTGKLVLAGHPGKIYQYIPPGADPTQFAPVWMPYLSHVDGYYYAQAPWHAALMTPFAALPYRAGFIFWSVGMVVALATAAALLWQYTTTARAPLWAAALLCAPLAIPFLTTNPWAPTGFAWHWIVLGGPLKWESALGATLWYGQYTPLILGLLTWAFVAAHVGRTRLAGLLLVAATMKPNVLFGVPLVLLVTDDWVDTIRWSAFWALIANILAILTPGLAYPAGFVHAVFSYAPEFWPIFLQAHNWVWMSGLLVVTVALHRDGIRETSLRAGWEDVRRRATQKSISPADAEDAAVHRTDGGGESRD